MCALASYALRTVGIAAFAVWVLDSLIRRRFREALIRGLLVLLPVAGWQAYVASVERSEAYKHPAYEYQRAPYLFYNVSYARNVVLGTRSRRRRDRSGSCGASSATRSTCR